MLVAGGFTAALVTGSFEVRATLGPLHRALLHGNAMAYLALLLGGGLVGVGARMAAGCTSGHGLSGCGRFDPASFVATACFFGLGVATSFLLRALA
jgi:uncharacterized membrane protein YedE/YeeE